MDFFLQNKRPLLQSYFPTIFQILDTNFCNHQFLCQSKIVEQHSQDQAGLKGQYPSLQHFKLNACCSSFDHCVVRRHLHYLLFTKVL